MLTFTREWDKEAIAHVWATRDDDTGEITLYEPYKDLVSVITEVKKQGFNIFHRGGVWHAYRSKKQIPLDWIMAAEASAATSFDELAVSMKKQFPIIDPARLARAVELCNAPTTAGANIVQNSDTQWRVRSQHTPHQWYTVSTSRAFCTCPDSQAGNLCKHRIAVQLFRQRRLLTQAQQPAASSTRASTKELLQSLGYD